MSKNSHEVRDIPGGVAVIGFFLSFLSGGALMWGYDAHRLQSLRGGESAAGADTAPWSDSDSPIPVDSKDPMWGHRLAPVTIVEFSDFECPFCARVEPALEQIKQNYGPDKVRILWKHMPIPNHRNARPASEAAAGVFALNGSEAFWKFHDLAFRNQNALAPANYERWAQQSGVTDLAKFKAGLASHKWASKVEQDEALSRQLNVNATPAFFINGVAFSGSQPYEKFKAVIDQELGKAQAKIAAGTPKSEIYTRSSKEAKNATPPPPSPAEAKDDGLWKVPIGKSPVLGSDKALVTIVTFSDFECVFCKRSEATMKQVRDTYGDKVRIVWKNEPIVSIHKHAEAAAQFALAARAEKGDKGFWDAHDKLFESAPKLEDEDFARIAKELGLSLDKVQSAIKEHKYKKEIDADQEAAEDVAATNTPHYFINGRRIVGAESFDRFKKVIDEEIAKSSALLAKGTKPADLYDTLVKDGKGAPELEKKTLPARLNAPTKGNPNAKVTIVEVSDFQCPYCRRAEDTMQEVMKNYGDRVKLSWRNFPLSMHEDAGLAAQASLEAFKQKGSDGFWKMHDLLFAAAPNENGLKREAVEKYAEQAGLDLAKFKAALDHQTHRAVVDEDVKAVSDAGINSTPGFIINGYYISGAETYSKFRKVIDRALAESK